MDDAMKLDMSIDKPHASLCAVVDEVGGELYTGIGIDMEGMHERYLRLEREDWYDLLNICERVIRTLNRMDDVRDVA